jgi:hypothetical protein
LIHCSAYWKLAFVGITTNCSHRDQSVDMKA